MRRLLPRAPLAVLFLLLGAGIVQAAGTAGTAPLNRFPGIVLWAWERPEDLRFLRPGSAGVAFLATTIRLDGGKFTVRPRFQPLRVAPHTPLMAVVRIESGHSGPVPAVAALAEEIAATARRPRIAALQIDFDARRSERPFYRELLAEVRRRLPAGVPLSMTALASWCLGDAWLDGLGVAEAVPMLFRLGPEREAVLSRVAGGFPSPACSTSFGVSLDEPISTPLPPAARRYYFSPVPWRPETVNAILSERTSP